MFIIENNFKDEPAGIRRESDNAWIPLDESNADYQQYLRWLENPTAEEFTGGTL